MTIKDDFKSKEKVSKKSKKEPKDEINTTSILLDDVAELKKCLKEKDKRLLKIENRFKLVKKVFCSLGSCLFLVPFILMIVFIKPIPEGLRFDIRLFCVIGVLFVIASSLALFLFTFLKATE